LARVINKHQQNNTRVFITWSTTWPRT